MTKGKVVSLLLVVVTGVLLVGYVVTDFWRQADSIIVPDPASTGSQDSTVHYQPIALTNQTTERLRFLRDVLILVERDFEDEDPQVLILEMNRREDALNDFVHYYSFVYMFGDAVVSDRTQFDHFGADVQPNGFLRSVENLLASDLSSRERYEFAVDTGELQLGGTLTDLQGDFVTKIQPGYTRYTSVGLAELEIDGEQVVFDASLEKIYADDYSRWIFFDGYEDLESTTDKLVLWDSAGAYYLLDTTSTSAPNDFYQPHTWVLHRDSFRRSQKSFMADVQRTIVEPRLFEWDVAFADLLIDFKVTGRHFFGSSRRYGVLEGTVVTNGEERAAHGFFLYKPR